MYKWKIIDKNTHVKIHTSRCGAKASVTIKVIIDTIASDFCIFHDLIIGSVFISPTTAIIIIADSIAWGRWYRYDVKNNNTIHIIHHVTTDANGVTAQAFRLTALLAKVHETGYQLEKPEERLASHSLISIQFVHTLFLVCNHIDFAIDIASVKPRKPTTNALGKRAYNISKSKEGTYKLGNPEGISHITFHHKFSNHTRYEIIIEIITTNKNLGILGKNLCRMYRDTIQNTQK